MKNQPEHSPSWDELMVSVNDAVRHPEDTLWNIYRYIKSNLETECSVHVRMLLAIYMQVRTPQPSLLNSAFLDLAAKASAVHPDFNFNRFLQAWQYPELLRKEDLMPGKTPAGRVFLPLQQRVERSLQSYLLHHPDERTCQTGTSQSGPGIREMLASRLFTKEIKGRRHLFVKMVDAAGHSILAESRQLPCRYGEIAGRMFDVLVRQSPEGKERVADAVCSCKRASDVFPVATGIVKGIDHGRRQYHVYDAGSRHFVAEHTPVALQDGDYVSFIPVVPADDPFKVAIIQNVVPPDEGRKRFGQHPATVLYANVEDNYLRYRLDRLPSAAPDGAYVLEGYVRLGDLAAGRSMSDISSVAAGSRLLLTLFLKRGKDGVKRNFVADMQIVRDEQGSR